MPRVYVGEARIAPEALRGFAEAGFEVVFEKTPLQAGPEDLALIPAHPGITSALRHEANNPLTAVIGFTQLLQRRPDLDGAAIDRLGKVFEHAVRIRDLLQKAGA